MTDTNYSPDEIRLLDEFAARWLQGEVSNGKCIAPFSKWAENSYDAAAAMIAERRKRVPSARLVSRSSPLPDVQWDFDIEPVAKPQPEPEQAGELTEEAVETWVRSDSYYYGEWHLTNADMDRAVALMREGLAAKEQVECLLLDLQRANESRASLTKERDEARAELTKLRTEAAGHDDFVRDAMADEANLRALRDRAKAVVERYTEHSGICEQEGCDVCPAVKLLTEVLP